jgi:hypothetical protein
MPGDTEDLVLMGVKATGHRCQEMSHEVPSLSFTMEDCDILRGNPEGSGGGGGKANQEQRPRGW